MNALGKKKPADAWHQVNDEHRPPRRVRGLWRRYDIHYANLYANDGKQYFYPLHGAATVPEAISKRQALKVIQRAGHLAPPRQMAADEAETLRIKLQEAETEEEGLPAFTLAEAVDGYRKDRDALRSKDPDTCAREDSGLLMWCEKFGDVLFEEITEGTLLDFATWRMERVEAINEERSANAAKGEAGRKPAHLAGRTLDLNVMALEHVRDWAKLKGHLPKNAPDWVWKDLATTPSKDELLAPEQIDELCNAGLLDPEDLELIDKRYRHLRVAQAASGQSFHDYLRLLQHAGGREQETTMQCWSFVTWSRAAKHDGDGGRKFKKGDHIPGNLFFPGENAKAGGGEPADDRRVGLHADLEAHLKAMYERRDPSTDWMFPARSGEGHTLRYNKQLDRVKKELREKYCGDHPGTEKQSFWFDRITFQWFRHYFISHCVMAGIDYKTIAYWVSHRDGGVLIGKLYGHLDTTHSEEMTDKLSAHLESRR